jgi:hypothetical protein
VCVCVWKCVEVCVYWFCSEVGVGWFAAAVTLSWRAVLLARVRSFSFARGLDLPVAVLRLRLWLCLLRCSSDEAEEVQKAVRRMVWKGAGTMRDGSAPVEAMEYTEAVLNHDAGTTKVSKFQREDRVRCHVDTKSENGSCVVAAALLASTEGRQWRRRRRRRWVAV